MTKNGLFNAWRRHNPPDTSPPANALAAGATAPFGLGLPATPPPGNALRAYSLETTTLFGESRRAYSVEIYPIGAALPGMAGVYALATETRGASLLFGRGFAPQYIGEAQSIAERVTPNHEKMAAAKRLGATHILVWRAPDSQLATREHIETDLRHSYDPPLNRQGLRSVF